jgi:hypothetical protein
MSGENNPWKLAERVKPVSGILHGKRRSDIMANSDCLDVLALKRLKEMARRSGGEGIPFSEFHTSLSPAMKIDHGTAWGVLKSMEDSGLIEIDPFDCIRLRV